ncbi:GAF and ANTAR domain-containing protein [Amycolatopsis jiangsuensis]|uniref:GAF domain-containing protein n=1 Tax=Amycolatopsis jiangsuensis TaxID=1181879 RepID=A0A840J6R6_9PSEU|nr:GAF and ANTAR domain-containing protein [Amycolatopsis jiangsuensis]MBB4689122.1 GAF domain-containing protein [Amycolatopsis jiangsuensis]
MHSFEEELTGNTRASVEPFETLTRLLVETKTVAEALQLVVDAAGHVVPNAALVSVTLCTPGGEFYTPVRTDAVAVALDEVQYRSGSGPCLDAARTDGPGYVDSTDLAVENRWPQFAVAAVQHGYGSILSTELVPSGEAGRLSGALNLYSRSPGGFTEGERYTALLLSTHASLALAHARGVEIAELERAQLQHAISTRDLIGQAKGILMQRQGISADEAFATLQRTSQDLNVKLVDLARTVTERHSELES